MKLKPRTTADLRKFGVVMMAPLLLIGGLLYWRGRAAAPWMLGIGALFGVLALVAPGVLRPVERGWMEFARRLSVVTTFILLSVSYFLVFTPLGVILRLLGKDRLDLRTDRERTSYWIATDPAGSASRPDKPY